MEVRPTFEREQKRSAARVQNVDYCFDVRKHLAVSVCGNETFWADRPRARLRRFCGPSCWSDLHFSTDCEEDLRTCALKQTWRFERCVFGRRRNNGNIKPGQDEFPVTPLLWVITQIG